MKKWGGHIAIIVGLILITLLFFSMMPPLGGGASHWIKTLQDLVRAGVVALIGLGFIAFAICFPLLFRGDVSTKDDHKNERRIRRVILYSYSVAALSMAGSLVPFLFVPSSFPGLYKLMLDSPVGIVLACSEEIQQDGTKKKEPELACKNGDSDYGQWMVNIGGMVPEQSKENAIKEVQESDGTKRSKPANRVTIRGGLVVPLYFIVLSLIGGAISLTRRVPEYHRRYSVNYVPTADKPRLDRATVREFLAFQIIQFISAPLLAIVAYYLISPESKTALVALGFTAGFASEAILLMIRALVEKISPANVSVPRTGAASGNVVDQAAANAPVANATVGVVGKPTLVTQTDARGHFAIDEIPIGD